MSTDTTGEQSDFESDSRIAGLGKNRAPQSRPVSLGWERVKRAANRQLSVFIIATVLVSGVAVLYELSDGARLPDALLLSLGLGMAIALAISVVLELGRNTITSIASLRKHRGYLVLGASPELTLQALRELPPDWRSPLGCLVFQPGSQFATAFRDLQGTIAKDHIVAFIGSIPNEGASTAALGAAISAQQQGRRVLLVDCDLRRRSLTRALVGDVEAGVMEAANRPPNWRSLLHQEAETGLHFLPAAKLKNPWQSLVGMAGFPILVEEMRKDYDLVIMDCPPTLGSADGAVLAGIADGCVVVAAWDDTPIGALRQSLRALRARTQAATGVYVNRVPPGYRFGRLRPD